MDDIERAAQTAHLDQNIAALKDLAQMVVAYFVYLITSGMDREEAFTLARDYQSDMMNSGRDYEDE